MTASGTEAIGTEKAATLSATIDGISEAILVLKRVEGLIDEGEMLRRARISSKIDSLKYLRYEMRQELNGEDDE